jgi:hypothetical protein
VSFGSSITAFSGLLDSVVSSVLGNGFLSSVAYNLADWFALGHVFAVKPTPETRLPETTFVQFKKRFISTTQPTPQIHRMKEMQKPDSQQFRAHLMPRKQVNARVLRLYWDNL